MTISPNVNVFDALLELRDINDAAETAGSVNEAGVTVDGLVPFHPDNDDVHYAFKVVFYGVSVSTDGSAIKFLVETDADSGFGGTPVEVGAVEIVAGSEPAMFELVLELDTIRKLDPDAGAMRVGYAITGGTTHSVDYGCYLAKV